MVSTIRQFSPVMRENAHNHPLVMFLLMRRFGLRALESKGFKRNFLGCNLPACKSGERWIIEADREVVNGRAILRCTWGQQNFSLGVARLKD